MYSTYINANIFVSSISVAILCKSVSLLFDEMFTVDKQFHFEDYHYYQNKRGGNIHSNYVVDQQHFTEKTLTITEIHNYLQIAATNQGR